MKRAIIDIFDSAFLIAVLAFAVPGFIAGVIEIGFKTGREAAQEILERFPRG